MIEAVESMDHVRLATLAEFLNQWIQEHDAELLAGCIILVVFGGIWLIAWNRRPIPRVAPRNAAVIADLLLSPDGTTLADGGRANLIWGKPRRYDCPEVLPFND